MVPYSMFIKPSDHYGRLLYCVFSLSIRLQSMRYEKIVSVQQVHDTVNLLLFRPSCCSFRSRSDIRDWAIVQNSYYMKSHSNNGGLHSPFPNSPTNESSSFLPSEQRNALQQTDHHFFPSFSTIN